MWVSVGIIYINMCARECVLCGSGVSVCVCAHTHRTHTHTTPHTHPREQRESLCGITYVCAVGVSGVYVRAVCACGVSVCVRGWVCVCEKMV